MDKNHSNHPTWDSFLAWLNESLNVAHDDQPCKCREVSQLQCVQRSIDKALAARDTGMTIEEYLEGSTTPEAGFPDIRLVIGPFNGTENIDVLRGKADRIAQFVKTDPSLGSSFTIHPKDLVNMPEEPDALSNWLRQRADQNKSSAASFHRKRPTED